MHNREKVRISLYIFLVLTGFLLICSLWTPATAQQNFDPTPSGTLYQSTPFITVTLSDPINVRTGPGSFDYPIIAEIPSGGTAPAIGRSPAGEWIQILFEPGPQGKGWVYAANVTLSLGALLPIVEPPPIEVPLEVPTINPTFAAAFQTAVPPTHLPTFTAPSTLSIPAFQDPGGIPKNRTRTSWTIFILGFISIVAFILSLVRRR